MRCDKDLGKWLNNAEEEFDQAAVIVEQSDERVILGLEDDYTKKAGGSASMRGVLISLP